MWIRRIWCLCWTATIMRRNTLQSFWIHLTFIKHQTTATSARKFICPAEFSSFQRKFSFWILSKIESRQSLSLAYLFFAHIKSSSLVKKLLRCVSTDKRIKRGSSKRFRCRPRLSLTATVMSRRSCGISSFAIFSFGRDSKLLSKKIWKHSSPHQSSSTFRWHQKWRSFKRISSIWWIFLWRSWSASILMSTWKKWRWRIVWQSVFKRFFSHNWMWFGIN